MTNERNRSIDLFRYVCAVMVVAIHTHPFEEINGTLGYVFSQIIPRIAVPFFFITSGYFYIRKLESGQKIFLPYLKRILKIYVLWSCVYFFLHYIRWGYADPREFIRYSAVSFVTSGSYYHFWYFPALIAAICLTTLFYKTGGKKFLLPVTLVLYSVGCLGCSYRAVGSQIPLLSQLFSLESFQEIRRVLMMGFPFFAAGQLVWKLEESGRRKGIAKKDVKYGQIVGIAAAVWLLEICLTIYFRLQQNIVVTFGLYPLTLAVLLFLLHHPMEQYRELSGKCHVMADITYYAHPLIMFVVTRIWGETVPQTMQFAAAVAVSWIFGEGVLVCRKKRRKA